MQPEPENQVFRPELRAHLRSLSLTATMERLKGTGQMPAKLAKLGADRLRKGMAADAMLTALNLWDRADAEAARGDLRTSNAMMDKALLVAGHALRCVPEVKHPRITF